MAVVFAESICRMFTEDFPVFTFVILRDFVWKAALLQLLLHFAINMCKQNSLNDDFRAHAL